MPRITKSQQDYKLKVQSGGTITLDTGPDTGKILVPTGFVGIGVAIPAAILDVQTTTSGIRFPNMTSSQKTSMVGMQAGTVIFDTTLKKLCLYTGTAWQTVTSA